MKILIVEDQRRVGRFVEKALAEQNYVARLAGSCAAARDAIAESPYDVVVLDLGLPDGDGLELLREWRESGFNTPILILSARDAVEDRIRGLNLGADDYLPKPFSVDELVARMRSLLRRQSAGKTTVLVHGPIRLDLVSHTVTCEGERSILRAASSRCWSCFFKTPTACSPARSSQKGCGRRAMTWRRISSTYTSAASAGNWRRRRTGR
jgi:DNA-binding response OmpR family regulator